jgi:PP-loop superfamily ATP-utilizing enzyme
MDYFRKLGFQFVALDLEGYVMGSLNRELSEKEECRHG